MPSVVELPPYQDIADTKADLDWADLITLDLSRFDIPGGKHELAAQLKNAIHKVGFFYLVNFGLSEEEVNKQFALGAKIFQLAEEEKQKYARNPELPGGPLGFQLRGSGSGQKPLVELYDDPKWNKLFKDRSRPGPCNEYREESAQFCRHLHYHVLYRLLVLTAIILELEDEEMLWKMHNYEKMSNCHMRYMLHHPAPVEERESGKSDSLRVVGHTDFGSFTLLFRQPVAGLQVRGEDDNSWKWVKPFPNSITVNVADTLSSLTGGYLKSSIHRVVQPPEDQKDIPRLGLLYFSRPDDDTLLQPVESRVIAQAGTKSPIQPSAPTTVGEWVAARHASIRRMYAAEKFDINGVKVPVYT